MESVDVLAEEFARRLRAGECPPIEEYARRLPGRAEGLVARDQQLGDFAVVVGVAQSQLLGRFPLGAPHPVRGSGAGLPVVGHGPSSLPRTGSAPTRAAWVVTLTA